jgi:ketosteroid isomerase-like protein
MAERTFDDHDAIRDIVRAINDHWRKKRYDLIGDLLAEEAVIAPPGLQQRVRGRDAYVQSYRDYDEAASTLEFSAGDPQVDVIGDVAVAVCAFDVVYETGGTTHREHGSDLLVFSRLRGEWKVV